MTTTPSKAFHELDYHVYICGKSQVELMRSMTEHVRVGYRQGGTVNERAVIQRGWFVNTYAQCVSMKLNTPEWYYYRKNRPRIERIDRIGDNY